MRTFKKGIAATAITTAALAGLLVTPSIAAATETAAADPAPGADCATQVTALQQTITDLTAAVALPVRATPDEIGLPPLPGTADPTALAVQLQSQVTGLADTGCLPALPATGADPVSACLDAAVDLQAEVSALLAALIGTDGPDVTAAVAVVTKLSATVTVLVSGNCLTGLPV
ncbi:hypothetical protein [Actinorhabdospora filicis]|uniref:hypothetical protein n=1 Tax=Actinorhabdospora filicis TaxID=1785913 RepID=UPI002553797D|nr:hypothetical protein [Actinorhabdospora filicis]